MKKATWGEALLGKKKHKIQMRRVKQMEKKVYCKDCMFYRTKNQTIDGWDRCNVFRYDTKSPIDWRNEFWDCPDYERKWWKVWAR